MFLSTWARQMRLLLWKNWILTWRSKKWLICELIVPLLIMVPAILLANVAESDKSKPRHSEPWNLYGNSSDFEVGSYGRTRSTNYKLAWTVIDPQDLERARSFIDKVASRFGSAAKVDYFDDQKAMIGKLATEPRDMSYSYSGDDQYEYSKFLGGVTIQKIDGQQLEYTISMPKGNYGKWNIEKRWDSFGSHHHNQDRGAYYDYGFIFLQFAIDDEFAKETGKESIDHVEMQSTPEPAHKRSPALTMMIFLPMLWAVCAFLSVLHSAREVVQERSTIKSFLAVMGLSTPMFYLSHIVFGSIKCCIIFSICAIQLIVVAENVNVTLLLAVILLYGCGAVLFGVVIASIFKKPNTVLKVSILAWGASVALPFVLPADRDFAWKCRLHALNINSAFQLTFAGIKENMEMDADIGWLNMFRGRNFSVGEGLLMMLFDVIWMTAAVFLFDFITENMSNIDVISFIRRKILKRANDKTEKVVELSADQKDAGMANAAKDIEIRNLVKMYPSSGQLAVNNLNLDVYRGQVTVLLGHNGAGKSTTFSMISGLTKPTEGSFSLCGEEMGMATTRNNMGLCPQHNALFNKLTVDDHLYLIHGLKGGKGNWKEEADGLLEELGLTEKRNTRSKELSGGMKRKLCVCMAVIGGSQVVLLDEPTAGMDPGARRDVERLLLKIKGDRSVLLTTHYMDEAELLGDRIAIMAKGRVVCSGTAQYLKNKFGDGYQLTVALDDGQLPSQKAQTMLKKANEVVGGVALKSINGKQIQFQLPANKQEKFPIFFEYLETFKDQLGIASFGLSFNTLEQVFLKVGELIEPRDQKQIEERKILNKKLIESQLAPRFTGVPLVSNQIVAILLKRFLYSRRNLTQLVTQFLLPMLCFGVIYVTTMEQKPEWNMLAGGRHFDVESFGRARVMLDQRLPYSDRYDTLIKESSGNHLVEMLPFYGGNLNPFVLNQEKRFPPVSYGAVWSNWTDKCRVVYNNHAFHSMPTSLNMFSNARLAKGEHISVSIQLYNVQQKDEYRGSKMDTSQMLAQLLPAGLVVVFALVTSAFVVFQIEERVSKFAHQQSLSGISPIVFWATSFLYDFLVYSILCAVFLGVFFINLGWFEEYLHIVVQFWCLYFFASVSFVYAMSFVFEAPSKANVLLIILQIIAPFAALLATYMLPILLVGFNKTDKESSSKALGRAFLVFLPGYNMFSLHSKLAGSMMFSDPTASLMDNIVPNMVTMLIFAVTFILTFVLFQFKSLRFTFKRLFESIKDDQEDYGLEDSDVTRERNKGIDDQDMALNVEGLKKRFKDHFAVNDLTFSVQNRECFGLLGVNGAGKTTTFDILTGQNYPSSGTAHIGGVSVDKQLAIGYCPQFDALLDDLTGRETLMTMARLYGFMDPAEKTKLILRAVGLYEHRHKLTKYYSGGQKRKLSTGMALMAPARIVILDEPTAGIDPMARRDIWEVLSNVRDHSDSSILLTSHSMEECEALCSRVAILKKGRMVAIGTSQHLKTKYGNSYTMFMVAKSTQHRCQVIKKVAEVYPRAVLKSADSAQSLTLRWQLPKTRDDKWSVVFAGGLRMAKSLQVEDFCLAQSSLEEAFLQISNQDNQTNQGNQGMVVAKGGVAITVPPNRGMPTNHGMVVGSVGDVITVPPNRATPITTASPMPFNTVSNATTGTSASTASFSTTSTASTSNENNRRGL